MATKAEQKLKVDFLVRKRVLAQRDVVEGFVANYDHERDGSQLSEHMCNLDRVNEEYKEIQSKIEFGDSEDQFDAHLAERCEFEDRFCVLKGFLLSKSSNTNNDARQSQSSSIHQQQASIHPTGSHAASAMVAGPCKQMFSSTTSVVNAAASTGKPNACLSRPKHASPVSSISQAVRPPTSTSRVG